jgi:hypothetical protein
MRAISIRQPYAEQILRRAQKFEYRSRPTKIRERVYIYASLTPGVDEAWREIGLQPGDLPTGVLVGTVEIVDCSDEPDGRGDYAYSLARPRRAKRKVKPKKHPQPVWFYPF